ncbi:MAG: glycosyl hydrolase, partial [Prevotella sp.]|nr:glycosyl hydrolase [Prevotella sp.]
MKKIFTTLALAIISLTTFAQAATDKYTVTTTDGNSTTHIINDENHLKFTDANTLVNYMTGFEDFGAFTTWNVDNIKSITFDIAHNNQIDVTGVNLADANATDATKKLYKYLQLIYGNKILSGIMAYVAWNHKEADKIHALTGKYPAINCYDFIHIGVPENNGWINYNNITPVTEWAEAGGIVNLMWHFNVPVNENTIIGTNGSGLAIKSQDTNFKAANALITGTWENTFFMQQLEKVANVILKLQDAGVVALWRP